MKAKIKVRQGNSLIKKYDIEYRTKKELCRLYQEARKAWEEYNVTMETSSHNVSYSHTYKEQFYKTKHKQ